MARKDFEADNSDFGGLTVAEEPAYNYRTSACLRLGERTQFRTRTEAVCSPLVIGLEGK
jgi:predicted chitinase